MDVCQLIQQWLGTFKHALTRICQRKRSGGPDQKRDTHGIFQCVDLADDR
ncbi:hypothetical protein GCM10023158_07070 [Gluconacetobacter tumulicola]